MDRLDKILQEVRMEFLEAHSKFHSFNSPHEGYAVIKEEVDELWDEVKSKQSKPEDRKKECTQIAAMAIRFIFDMKLDKLSKETPNDQS